MRESKFLKIISIIALIFGVLDVVGYIVSLSYGTALDNAGIDYSYHLSNIWTLAFSVMEIFCGIFGLMYFNRPERISSCIDCGWVMIMDAALEYVFATIAITSSTALLSQLNMTAFVIVTIISLVFDLIVPVLYMLAAYRFKRDSYRPGC